MTANKKAKLKNTSRFVPLPELEREVCRRAGDCRRYERTNQTEFSAKLGLTRNQLANLESMRVPLRFWTGWKICSLLNVNQVWLANGTGPQRPFIDLDLKKRQMDIKEGALFSEVITGVLLPDFESRTEFVASHDDQLAAAEILTQSYEDALVAVVKSFMMRIPESSRGEFIEHLTKSCRQFEDRLPRSRGK